MNFESLRSLLYPLGFLASIFFSLRFLIQWIQSERQKKSMVSKTFWRLSLTGNLLTVLHSLIQLQYPIAALQSLNGVIAFRNLNLMGPAPFSFRKTLTLLFCALGFVTLLFFLPFFFIDEPLVFMRHPVLPWNKVQATDTSFLWQLTGFIGLTLFGSRFCVQWWLAEKHKSSFLGRSFWWMSLFGACISLFYFIRIGDPVNILGYGLGMIPYARNLKLLLQKRIFSSKKEEIFFIAGEMSGDVLGANLLKELHTHLPTVAHYGVGGPQMRAQGLRCLFPTEHLQVMGFTDVFKALPRLYSQFQKIQKYILRENPKAVVFIDYPDFNMRLAKRLRKKGYSGKLIHYVCPSVWAWRASRIQDMEKRLNLLLTVLPFEKQCFVNSSLAVTFVGHPLVAAKDAHLYDVRWREEISFLEGKKILSLFPGSRSHEIALNLPKLLEVAALSSQEIKDISIAISVAHSDLENPIREIVRKYALPVALVPFQYRYELMKESYAALATSGTVTFELALHQIPTVVVYKISLFNYLLGRYFFRIRLPHFTLVNLIANKTVFPEFIHRDFSTKDVATALKNLIDNRETCFQECHRVRSLLTEENASKKAADAISLLLKDSP